MKAIRLIFKIIGIIVSFIIVLCFVLFIYIRLNLNIAPPELTAQDKAYSLVVNQVDSSLSTAGNGWLHKDVNGVWELYIEGSPFQRGIMTGILTKQLIYKQEVAFTNQIKELIPSAKYLKFLRYFIGFFNRNIEHYITEEYKEEIYGVSKFASDEFDYIEQPYERLLNYHAAHDIGHALQDYNLVGCTSFAAWGSKTDDSLLVVGRNFDFYVGDEFAENKIILFCKPDKGYAFMMITWGGMMGAVSGMNSNGLTVTINAAKSSIPTQAKTPISLLAREILQYAGNIDQAYEIAQKRKTFVSESILIGSSYDHKAAIIEKSPEKIALVYPESDYIVCTNHFQSPTFMADSVNVKNIRENATGYRYQRTKELLEQCNKIDYKLAAGILRNHLGLNNDDIGMGNEKAVNQFIAHHSVIFMPELRLVWVSTQPWQFGEYLCYNLDSILNNPASRYNDGKSVSINEMSIPADSFLESVQYQQFLQYKTKKREIEQCIRSKNKLYIDYQTQLQSFVAFNPEYYYTYVLAGDLCVFYKNESLAVEYYSMALKKEIPSLSEKLKIKNKISDLSK